MAKRSEIIGEYILTINDNNSVNVSFVPDNTKKELLGICESKGIPASAELTTHQIGNLLFKELGKRGDKELVFDEYEIKKDDNGRINVLKSFANTKEGLRIISEKVGFNYDKAWDTQHFGRQLLNFIETGQQPEIKEKDTKPEENPVESASKDEIKSEPEQEIKLFEGILPTLSFTAKEKRNALENSKGIIVMARQLMNLSDLETLIRYQEEEDLMVLIAINNKTGHVGATLMSDDVDGIFYTFKKQCNIDSLEDYTLYYTSIECGTDDVEEFIETGYYPLYLDKNRVGMYDDQCFAESELRKTLNKKFNNTINADLDIFAGMNKIYSCNRVEVYQE